MKNLLLAVVMLFAIHTFAQETHTIDFEPGGTGADWDWVVVENADNPPLEFVANPDNAGINPSATAAKFTARADGQPWALCFTDDNGVFTFDASNSIVKIMVYKPVISNVGIKFEGLGQELEILVPNTLINEWEELTYDFSEMIGNSFSRMVIIPDFDFTPRPGDQIIYLDNIQVPGGVVPPPPGEPSTVPPTPPHAQENVLSIYSEAYDNLPGTDFNPNWGQSTQVTVDYMAAGNKTLRYMNLNYQGTQFAVNQDVSEYEYVHVDFWTPNSTALNFYLISPGNEIGYALPITHEEWVSVDIPLTYFVPPVNLTDVFQFKVDGNGTVFFDNWYFWKSDYDPLTDASLSDLQADGVTVPGFAPNTFSYDVVLPAGTIDVPVVTATTTNPNASYDVTDAAALPGTSLVVVTAEDGVAMQTYEINFTVEGDIPISDYCETLIYHFGIETELASIAYLTIKNLNSQSMFVEIESANDDPVDFLLVTGGSGAMISDQNFSVPGKISRVMSWDGTPPAEVTLNVLWSKESFSGNWMLNEGDIIVPFEAVCEPSGPSVITFRVDMSQFEGIYTNVFVSGSFNGWSGDANQLFDVNMNGIYEAAIELENGSYEYKFTLDNWAVQEEFAEGEPCTVTISGFTNRALEVAGSAVLPAVCWNSCFECVVIPEVYDVTFSVDMSQMGATYGGVFLNGNFNGWCGDCTQMFDHNSDGVYEVTIQLGPGGYEYKFTLDGWSQQEWFAEGDPCTVTNFGFTNRYVEISENTVIPTVCYNSCEACPDADYPAGWHGISSNVIPEDASLDIIFSSILEKMTILLSQNGIFWPGQNINTLGDWDTYQGYKVRFNAPVFFEFSGLPLTDRSVTFDPGIYYVPVLSEGPVSLADLIDLEGNDVDFMFDISNALIYWPLGGIVPGVPSALETLYPGYAYLTKFSQTVTFDFGAAPPKSSFVPIMHNKPENTTGWNDASSTGAQHILSIQTSQLRAGDFVGAFDAAGTCVGLAQYDGNSQVLALVAFGNDITTQEKDGLVKDEPMTFRIFRDGSEITVTAIYDESLNHHDGKFAENGLSIITEFKMGATMIEDNNEISFNVYPNPANGVFTLAPIAADSYDVIITNMQGQQVYAAKINGKATINLTGQAKGLYFIRLSNSAQTLIKKIVIE